ncbi:hypothetical protein EYF80_062785 [Liparis tanakae]|uniref:Uncharacterized protein n=1 Tax=Liparis tanakae TaxID=230148 RepID=A0A4Z2EEA0_9TELE|nr:hypothetical protein EYF80_062785 [Liparis tanakae]
MTSSMRRSLNCMSADRLCCHLRAKFYIFGQTMEELARTAVADKQLSAMVKAMSFLLSVQGVDDLY